MHALPALSCEAIGVVLALSILAAGRWLTGSSTRPTPLERDEDLDHQLAEAAAG